MYITAQESFTALATMQLKTMDDRIKCVECGRRYRTENGVRRHLEREHADVIEHLVMQARKANQGHGLVSVPKETL